MSILLGQGSGSSWTLVPGPRIKTDAGPVAVAVGNILGTGQLDLAVANQQANNVQVFPGVGGGFFSPECHNLRRRPGARRTVPGQLQRLGHADRRAQRRLEHDLADRPSTGGVTQTIPTGGVRPTSGFAGDFNGNGFTDLVVGNNGDGRIALFLGGAGGLSLSQTITSAEVPEPDVAELRGGLRRRAQLLRHHGRPRGGLASGLQPEPAARLRYRRPFRPDAVRDDGAVSGRRAGLPRRPACSSRSDCSWARAARCST